MSAFRIITSESEEKERIPACVLASASEMSEILESEDSTKLSEGSKTSVAQDGDTPVPNMDETNPTIITMAPTNAPSSESKAGKVGEKEETVEAATATLHGYSVRPDVLEGTYEFVTDATPLDKNESINICGILDPVRFEVTINPQIRKERRRKNNETVNASRAR